MCPIDPTKKQKEKLEKVPLEPIEPEKMPAPEKEQIEKRPEEVIEVPEEKVEEMKEGEKEAPPAGAPATAAPAPAIDTELKEIQNVMQENIIDLYTQMTPVQQKQFRDEGVKAAQTIKGLLAQVKVNAKKIIDVLKSWLSRLPGINKYFLEQESKIKLDKLLEIKKEREGQGTERIME